MLTKAVPIITISNALSMKLLTYCTNGSQRTAITRKSFLLRLTDGKPLWMLMSWKLTWRTILWHRRPCWRQWWQSTSWIALLNLSEIWVSLNTDRNGTCEMTNLSDNRDGFLEIRGQSRCSGLRNGRRIHHGVARQCWNSTCWALGPKEADSNLQTRSGSMDLHHIEAIRLLIQSNFLVQNHTELRSSQREIVIHELSPRYDQSCCRMIAKVLLVVNDGRDGPGAREWVSTIATSWLTHTVVIGWRKNSAHKSKCRRRLICKKWKNLTCWRW